MVSNSTCAAFVFNVFGNKVKMRLLPCSLVFYMLGKLNMDQTYAIT